ncbi:MAG: metallophosphoesterase [Halobacteriota archaeon]
MSNLEPEPLVNEPALTIDRTLVLADLHIGIEYELSLSGINIPSQIDRRIVRVLRLLDIAKAERVVLLGDIKHTISKISKLEREDVPRFLRSIAELVEVDIIPGNHDAGLEYLIPRDTPFNVELHPSKGCRVSDVGLMHGHTWPASELLSCRYVIMGHNHPAIRLTDSLGYASSKPAWIRTHFVEDVFKKRYVNLDSWANSVVIIMPAFNELAGGIAFNEASYDTLVGPLFASRAIMLEQAQAYLLDGTYLGTIEQLAHLTSRRRLSKKPSRRRRR